jgi:hypothetical protein
MKKHKSAANNTCQNPERLHACRFNDKKGVVTYMAHVADHLGCIWGFGLQQPSRQHTRHRHCCSTNLLPSRTPEPKEREGKWRTRKLLDFANPEMRRAWGAISWSNELKIVGEDAAQPKELVRRCFECAMHNWLAMQRKGDARVLGAYTHHKWASCREPPHWEPWELWNIPDASVTALWFPESPLGTWSKGQNGGFCFCSLKNQFPKIGVLLW